MTTINELVLDENNTAFHPAMGNSYQLNDTSKEILTLLKHQKTKDEILDILHEKYSINKNELFIDVSDFLSKLKIYGLVS